MTPRLGSKSRRPCSRSEASPMNAAELLASELDPSLLMDYVGFTPDEWQRRLLRSTSDKILLNCHRQAGKSTATAPLAVGVVLSEPGSLVLVVSASQRQANELF